MTTIIIIGAGQLGSRHLQSLNLIQQPLDIIVVDPNVAALETAKSRFEATIQETQHQIRYERQIPSKIPADIAIIASTAQIRRKLVENLLTALPVKHLVLEKLLFTQEQDYHAIADLLSQHSTQTWVNCTMRMMPYYKNLKQLFNNEAIQYQVTGSQYGLITNAIHYLDHLAYLTGTKEFTLDLNYLDHEIINSKREGYLELTGTLLARFADGSVANIHCDKQGMAPTQIQIYNHKHRVISREWEQKAWQTSLEKDWQWEELSAPIPFQSSLTAELVNSLLATDKCQLTDYVTSMQIHLQLLEPLMHFLKERGVNHSMDYPFT